MDIYKDAAMGVLGASADLAGLLLVFMGYVYAKGEGFDSVKRGAIYKNAARAGVIPLIALLSCAWFALNALQPGGQQSDYQIAMFCFRASLWLIGLYAWLVLFVHL